jgi:hypothetical protein
MAERKAISKKIRFEVFKRDAFKCQYCGRSAPDVILNVDHIKPVKEGGTNHLTNLITSCFDCNSGKKDRLLDDNSVIEKQRKQLEELNERRAQLEMMMQWREGLANLEEDKVKAVAKRWAQLTQDYHLNENGLKALKSWIRNFEINLILDCMEISLSQYGVPDAKNMYTKESVEKAFNYVPKIAKNKQKEEEKPYLKELYYMRGILKNRLNYYDPHKALNYLEKAYLHGASLVWLKELCLEAPHWTYFRQSVEQFWEETEE